MGSWTNPTDRVLDGVDQTALLLNGDTSGRRDYVHIYTGPMLAATVKGDYKRQWITGDPTDASGIGAAFHFLPLESLLEGLPNAAEGVGLEREGAGAGAQCRRL